MCFSNWSKIRLFLLKIKLISLILIFIPPLLLTQAFVNKIQVSNIGASIEITFNTQKKSFESADALEEVIKKVEGILSTFTIFTNKSLDWIRYNLNIKIFLQDNYECYQKGEFFECNNDPGLKPKIIPAELTQLNSIREKTNERINIELSQIGLIKFQSKSEPGTPPPYKIIKMIEVSADVNFFSYVLIYFILFAFCNGVLILFSQSTKAIKEAHNYWKQ